MKTKTKMIVLRGDRVEVLIFGLFLLLTFGLMLPSSCTHETLLDENTPHNGVSDNVVRLELFTNADDFNLPLTRTGKADEDLVGNTLWVFVFKNVDTDPKIFVEAAQAEVINSKLYVTLEKSDDKRILLILANPPVDFSFYNNTTSTNENFKDKVKTWLTGKTYDEARKMLTTALTSTCQTTAPYTAVSSPYPLLPMSGSLPLDKITSSTTIGTSTNTVALYRIVAKVTVTNEDNDFELAGATVAGASRQGYLFPVTPVETASDGVNLDVSTNYLTSTSGKEVTDIAAIGTTGTETTDSNPIYIYESEAGQTSVIIQGKYKNKTYYYKLAFQHATDAGPMAIERNHWYQFKIISVDNIGYDSVTDAIAAPPSNITALMDVTELSSYDIIDNGQYYLGVSNSEFIAYSDVEIPSSDNVVAVTVCTNAITGLTPNSVTTSTTGAGSFSITQTSLNLSATSTSIGETKLIINLPATFTTLSVGTITIKLGNLTKEIKVTRRLALEYGTSKTEFSNDFSAGKVTSQGSGGFDWLSLSLDGDISSSEVTHPYAAGKITMIAKKNSILVSAARKGGEVYLSRQSKDGRVKLYVNEIAIGENCYIVKPNGSVSIPVARANASGLGTQLDPVEAFSYELVWTTTPNVLNSSSAILKIETDGSGSHGHLVVYTGSTQGNAVVAITKGGIILWSWHIWVTNLDPEEGTYSSNIGQTFMKRNLGATDDTQGSFASRGLLYQWGRKDPFVGSSLITGNGGESTVYKVDGNFQFPHCSVPSDSEISGPNYNLGNTIMYPTRIYIATSGYDWYSNSTTTQNNDLWGGGLDKAVYDPCPEGWRVPESTNEDYSSPWGDLTNPAFTPGTGADWTGIDTGRGYYPAAGYRDCTGSALLYNAGIKGRYWSGSSGGPGYGLYLGFTNNVSDFDNLAKHGSAYRSFSHSVRCVKI